MVSASSLTLRFVPEELVTAEQHEAIRELLVAAHPQSAGAYQEKSWRGTQPDYRLWIEDERGFMLVHLGFGPRLVDVGQHHVLIAGVGGGSTRPIAQRRGLGRLLNAELHRRLLTTVPVDFGFVHCEEELAHFYEATGWQKIDAPVHELDLDSGEPGISSALTFIMPAGFSALDWPAGEIDLRGRPW